MKCHRLLTDVYIHQARFSEDILEPKVHPWLVRKTGRYLEHPFYTNDGHVLMMEHVRAVLVPELSEYAISLDDGS